jgi:site-specific DNA-methyltransferase (adenine-specific)
VPSHGSGIESLSDLDNTLYYGDNLVILRDFIKDESIDLIYLDPPFNSKADYNIIYREPTGEPSKAQITAFEDTWHWEGAVDAFNEIMDAAPTAVAQMMKAFKDFLGPNDMMAYLSMMCIRLIQLKKTLKDTGSIYPNPPPALPLPLL